MTLLFAVLIASALAIPMVWWPARNLEQETSGTPVLAARPVTATRYAAVARQRLASAH